jgi:uncharacterized tellurite resistance protein B-like protein
MNELLRKKINLLVHLAKVDGKMDQSEHEMLLEILREYNISDFKWNKTPTIDLADFEGAPSRAEILYLALRIIRADGIIHPDEVAYCKALALKLEFNAAIVDHYTGEQFPSYELFKIESKAWHL